MTHAQSTPIVRIAVVSLAVALFFTLTTASASQTTDCNNLPPGLNACDTPCACRTVLDPPNDRCGGGYPCTGGEWSVGQLLYCTTSGCCVYVHYRSRYCPEDPEHCQLSIDRLEYLIDPEGCVSCRMVPDHFTSQLELWRTIELWMLLQPYEGLHCYTEFPRDVSVNKASCMEERWVSVDSCGHPLVNSGAMEHNQFWIDNACLSSGTGLKRVIMHCSDGGACCHTKYRIDTNASGQVVISVKPGYPRRVGPECTPRLNPPPTGVPLSVWELTNPPMYDPNASCKDVCNCEYVIDIGPPAQYNRDCDQYYWPESYVGP